MRFADRRVLVTGAASGIGRAVAVKMASEGARVFMGDVNEAGLEETSAVIAAKNNSQHAAFQTYDASDITSCQALVAAAVEDGLDVLCNIAGILDWGETAEFDEIRFARVIAVNLTSVFALCRAALPYLTETKGNIVNMSSTAGLDGIAYSAAYSASKHGVVGLTKSLALEYAAREVRINAVAPSQVNTNMGRNTPPPSGEHVDWNLLKRASPKLESGAADPADIANAVAYLASSDARKVTGTILNVDCGQLAG